MNNEAELDLTAERKSALATLRSLRDAKVAEISALLSQDLDYGGVAADSRNRKLADETAKAIEFWNEEAEMDRREPSTHSKPTPLQRLLNEHYDLGEQILDILDEATGRQ